MSKRDARGVPIPTPKWINKPLKIRNRRVDPIEAMYRYALDGIGEPEKERCFRMQITLCIHRGATPEEVAGLPRDWHEALSGMAGGPVEVLWERGVESLLSAKPCANPRQLDLGLGHPDLWVPRDCGRCPSCVARKQMEEQL